MSAARFVVGIDLGTTNSAVAYVDTQAPNPTIEPLPILQVVRPGVVEARPSLPSFLYLPSPSEMAPESLALPWGRPFADEPAFVVGEFAREHGWRVPIRLISSAKSWLSTSSVDRTAAILPWQAPAEVPKLSPVDCATKYLSHIRAAWDHTHKEAPLAEQDVFLTVPASFDAVARELTVQAAHHAGLAHVTLLEEPQAAFYAWLGKSGDGWRRELASGDVVLVCDVGGGTTDFSLIAVTAVDGNLELERVAVGDHILLGGDNMDLALAHAVRARLESPEGGAIKLDSWQFASLAHSCRRAKEQLYADGDLLEAPVVVLGRGSKIIGGSVNTTLSRAELNQVLTEGFFPQCSIDERPRRDRRLGLRELGLHYASDAAITRHLAAFVGGRNQGRPATAVLFNGGVMKARPLARRVTETLDGWSTSPDDDLKLLTSYDLDLAVAHGAAYYGLVRRGRGIRIRGGTARAYYVGIESAAPAVPGMAPPLKALCVAPMGMEEGTEVSLEGDGRELGMVLGEPAEFHFLASSTRKDDRAGVLLDTVDDLEELSPVSTVLGDPASPEAGQVIPVTLRSKVTEIGTLELWCVGRGDQRWKLEYNVRDTN